MQRELAILRGFYQMQPANRVAHELGITYPTVTRVYRRLREKISDVAEAEGKCLSGEIEIDESYFGGHRKGNRGRGAAGKSVVLGLLERDGRVYTTVVDNVLAAELMTHIKAHTRKGSVYFTDTFHSYNSLTRFGVHGAWSIVYTWSIARRAIILMASKGSGVMRSICSIIIAASHGIISRCISRKSSIASIIVTKICLNCFCKRILQKMFPFIARKFVTVIERGDARRDRQIARPMFGVIAAGKTRAMN